LSRSTFSVECPWDLDGLLADDEEGTERGAT
jgi:hypothetical protein